MLSYLKMLDRTNAKIIEGLTKYDPRNLSSLAERIGLPPTTVAFRLKKLTKDGFLKIVAKLNSPRLGLVKAVLVAEPNHGLKAKLQEVIENIGYWTYVARCYGKFNGFYAIFSFPAKHKTALEEYLAQAKSLGAMSDYRLFWTTNIHDVAPKFDLYDFKRNVWSLPWSEWVNETLAAPQDLPQHLGDPNSYEIEVDYRDLLILKELEKDALASFTDISKVVKISPQAVRYRFQQHAKRRRLLAGYELAIFPYPLETSELCAVVFDFPNEKALAKFANSLSDKPFVLSYAKLIGENSLLGHFYVPKSEFSRFIDSVERLTREEIIRDFFFVTLDVRTSKRQTVSYEYFDRGKWIYNKAEEIRKLAKMIPLRAELPVSIPAH
jgi:DNA-binding Lrp family transcriptional regulator